jgi:hypothetical protein
MYQKAENYLLLTIRTVGPSTFIMFVSIKEIGHIKSIMTTSYVFNISAFLVAYTFIHDIIPFVQATIGIAVMSAGKTF